MSRRNRQQITPTPTFSVNPENVYPLTPKWQRIIQEDGISISLNYGPGSYQVHITGGLFLQENQVVTIPDYLRIRKNTKEQQSLTERRELFVARCENRPQLQGVVIPENFIEEQFLKELNEEQSKFLMMKERDYRSFLSTQKNE